MDIELRYQPGNTVARVSFAAGESLTAESGAMIAMSSKLNITTTTHKKNSGGIFKAAKRLLGGESFFLNHFDTESENQEIWLGTSLSGDMTTLELDNQNIIVQSGSFLASTKDIDLDVGWQGFKSLFSGEGLFWLNVRGSGSVILSSFGAIFPIKVDGEHIVDSGHIVAFDETLDFDITKAGKSWLHSFLGGEGLVCKFKGKGTVWCQSHNPKSFGHRLAPSLRPKRA